MNHQKILFVLIPSLLISFSTSLSLATPYSADVEVCPLVNEDASNSIIWQPLGCAAVHTGSPDESLLFVDSRNQVIRQLKRNTTTGGTGSFLSILAGTYRKKAYEDGQDIFSSFSMPYSISVPPINDPITPYAIVADYGNKCIRKISLSTNDVTTIACGGGIITSPSDTAVTHEGNIYIADPISHTILFYNASTQTITRVAGIINASGLVNGNALTTAKFNQPLGIAVHAFTGHLYIADWLNDAIRIFTHSTNTVSTLISGRGFQDSSTSFSNILIAGPKSVRMVGAQTLAISDADNGAIRLVDLAFSKSTTLFGNGTRAVVNGNASTEARGSAVWGMTGTLDGKNIYFTEADTNTLRHAVLDNPTGECTTIQIDPEECGTNPKADVLHETSYLFTNGDSGFLSSQTPKTIITQRLPPSTTQTRTVLSLPHASVENMVHGPIPPQPIIGYTTTPPTSVQLFIKTPDVYVDTCRIQGEFSVYPANSMPEPTFMVLSLSSSPTPLEILCNSQLSTGQCTSTLANCQAFAGSDFSATRMTTSVSIRRGSVTYSQPGRVITFHKPTIVGLMNTTEFGEGIYVDAPRGVLIPSVDELELKVYANVGRFTLYQWGVSLQFDQSVLEFLSVNTPPTVFSSPSVATTANTVAANTKKTETALVTALQGSKVEIATIRFRIIASSQNNQQITLPAISNFLSTFLVNDQNNQFVTNKLATVYDYTGKSGNSGAVSVAISRLPQTIGILTLVTFPYVITKPDGSQTPTFANVHAISDIYNSDPQVITNDASCVTQDTTSISLVDCSQINPANANIAVPNPAAVVQVAYSSFGTNFTIRAYAPTSIRLALEDNNGENAMNPLEMRRISTFVRWAGDPLGDSEEVDVTNTLHAVPILSSSANVIRYENGFLYAAGMTGLSTISLDTTIKAHADAPISQKELELQVVDSPPSSSLDFQIIQYNGNVAWVTPTAPKLQETPLPSKEGDTNILMVVSLYHGGTLFPVDSITSNHPNTTYSIDSTSIDENIAQRGYAWKGRIPVNAVRVPCESLILSASSSVITSIKPRNLNLPIRSVVSITICCSNAERLTPAGDLLLQIPGGYAQQSYSGLTATAHYSDNTVQVITSDSRIQWETVQNSCGATVSDHVINSVTTFGVLEMRAIFNGNFTSENTVTLQCVTTTAIQPFFNILGLSSGPRGTIHRVNCATNVFQSGRVHTRLQRNDGVLVDGLPDSQQTCSTSTTLILQKTYSNNGFSGKSLGDGIINVTVGSFSASIPITVLDESVSIPTISVAAISGDTFSGNLLDQKTLNVGISMSDGSSLSNIFQGGWPDYTSSQLVGDILTVSTDDPTSIGVDQQNGALILVNNSYQLVEISVSSITATCSGVPQGSVSTPGVISVAGNVALNFEGDVDLGASPNGIPILLSSYQSATVPVRIRSNSAELKAFEITLLYNPAHIEVQECAIGADWSGDFSCSIDSGSGNIRILGADIASNARGTNLRIASFSFNSLVINTITRIRGFRGQISVTGSSNIACQKQDCSIIAGDVRISTGNFVPFNISPIRRRSLLSSSSWEEDDESTIQKYLRDTQHLWNPRGQQRRKLLMHAQNNDNNVKLLYANRNNTNIMVSTFAANNTYGDTNGDGSFNVLDYLFAQEYYNNAPNLGCPLQGGIGCQPRSNLSNWQQAQLYPVADPNAPTGGRDLFYLFNTLANKLRFVVDIDFQVSENYFYFAVKLNHPSTAQSNPVRIIFALHVQPANNISSSLNGYYDQDNTGLIIINATSKMGGWYSVSNAVSKPPPPFYPSSLIHHLEDFVAWESHPFSPEMNVGVAFAVETADERGQFYNSDPQRRSPFFGIQWGPYASGYDSFSPYALVNLTVYDLCLFMKKEETIVDFMQVSCHLCFFVLYILPHFLSHCIAGEYHRKLQADIGTDIIQHDFGYSNRESV